MKRISHLCYTISLCAILLLSSSCYFPHKHTHDWKNYIVKTPTCTEKGLMEKLCEECGDKKYEDLMPSGHNFVNGACTVCGIPGYAENQIEPQAMPENANNTAAWSLEKIHQTAQSLGFTDPYDSFIRGLQYGHLDNIYIDPLGLLHFKVTFINKEDKELELPFAMAVSKVSPINKKDSKFGFISKVQIQNEQLILTYSDGIQASAGALANATVTVTKFGLNPDNELVIYYSNNTIAFAGKISEGKIAETQIAFVYQQKDNGYAIIEAIDTGDKVLTLPISHQGKLIISIEENAFKLFKEKTVSVVVPKEISSIHANAFYHLNNSCALYFEGNRSDYVNFNTNARMYFMGEWSQKNGIPTPNK